MIRYDCDRCGEAMSANDTNRYIAKLEVYAAASPIDVSIDDTKSAPSQLREVIEQLKNADPGEIEDKTYRSFRFDVCDNCRKHLIANPLQRNENAK